MYCKFKDVSRCEAKLGDIVILRYESVSEPYIIAKVDEDIFRFICLRDGNRWSDVEHHSVEELLKSVSDNYLVRIIPSKNVRLEEVY